ncbi:LytTR family DNA-binding domain-containing protein [Hymenobacter sp. DH14]|uniref:LytTR family DNA-binding domain-containing protein n=1 Tax=Hymenobacter cyanobacteriorum TaxID=2926463 RepID=A0A9X1VD94_9BACT|nr:LytTR family DNA-binding domain-containing protein [Hymenobacter cyanobacteriorum]
MISCLIVDDEQAAIDILRQYVEKTPFLTLAGTTTNPIEALRLVATQPVDLVFLDIHMPQLSGLEVLPLLRGKCQVIFTTAYSEFAVPAFELEALDYLLKPIAFERFVKASQKALKAQAPVTLPVLPAALPDDYIFVKGDSKGHMRKVAFNDIVYVEGLKNYVSIYTEQERIITLLNIKDLQERLPATRFMRVHKSYIVSLDKIKALDGNLILFRDGKATAPLGDTYRRGFFEALQRHVVGGKSAE